MEVVRSEERGLYCRSQIIPSEPHGKNAVLFYSNDVS